MPDQADALVENQWCPGCSNFGVLTAVRRAFESLEVPPHRRCLVSGIGQAAKLPHYLPCNVFNGLHGRAVPAATAIQVANPELTTVVTTGEGDCYGEGGNHFLHALRRNPNITLIVHDNRLYALTKGQASPMTPLGERTRLQVLGTESRPFRPLATAILHDCGFVARGFAGDIDQLTELFSAAISYRGLSIVDVIQPCITWGPHPVSWYRERIAAVGDSYDPTDKATAMATAAAEQERLPIGILYRGPERSCFGDRFRSDHGWEETPMSSVPWTTQQEIATRAESWRVGSLGNGQSGKRDSLRPSH